MTKEELKKLKFGDPVYRIWVSTSRFSHEPSITIEKYIVEDFNIGAHEIKTCGGWENADYFSISVERGLKECMADTKSQIKKLQNELTCIKKELINPTAEPELVEPVQ